MDGSASITINGPLLMTFSEILQKQRSLTGETASQVALAVGIGIQEYCLLESELNCTQLNWNVLEALSKHFQTFDLFHVVVQNSNRYNWLKNRASRIEWKVKSEDGMFSCNRPELEEHVDRAINSTNQALGIAHD